MTLRYRLQVALMILRDWERAAHNATDAAVRADASPTPFNEHAYERLHTEMELRWEMLTEWLNLTGLRGSSVDPTSDLYLSVTR
jgi:hypothetical protein